MNLELLSPSNGNKETNFKKRFLFLEMKFSKSLDSEISEKLSESIWIKSNIVKIII